MRLLRRSELSIFKTAAVIQHRIECFTYGGAQRSEYVHVMSGFGVLALALRQRNVNKDSFTSEVFQQIVITVNTIPLEETGAKFNTEITKRDHNIGPVEALLDCPPLMFSTLSLSVADILRSNEISPNEI